MLHILRLECFYRETHKIEMNMGMAKFPSQASIESFDFSCSQLDKSEILSLAKCDWIASHENVLFYGQPGLGKTHLAIALGKKAIVDKGYSVKFISANDLMAELAKARQQKAVDDYLRLINRADLIIVDEFGYPLMENHPSYAALFHALISSRYEKRAPSSQPTAQSLTGPGIWAMTKIAAAQFLTASCTTQYAYVLRAKVTGRGI